MERAKGVLQRIGLPGPLETCPGRHGLLVLPDGRRLVGAGRGADDADAGLLTWQGWHNGLFACADCALERAVWPAPAERGVRQRCDREFGFTRCWCVDTEGNRLGCISAQVVTAVEEAGQDEPGTAAGGERSACFALFAPLAISFFITAGPCRPRHSPPA